MFDVASLPKRFRVVRQLGAGGMGVVYEVYDEERGARIALKTITNLNPVSLARFKREFRAVAHVQHHNLVSLGELIYEEDTWFFTMELVEGCDFLEYVRPSLAPRALMSALTEPEAPLPAPPSSTSSERAIGAAPGVPSSRSTGAGFDEPRLRAALTQLGSALEALHAGGIAHRDIKPANIRVTDAGRVVLLDFGLAEDFTRDASHTQARMAGTPAYMAPEQAASGAVGPPADWYAVGVLLYEAMTGALPFGGAPLAVMMEKQQDGPAPSARVAGVPPDLDALCERLLRFKPDARPTGVEVLRALGGGRDTQRSVHPPSFTNAPLFVGRAAELATLREAFAASRAGAVTVLVEGESGIGKSGLVRAFIETLEGDVRDLVVLAGRCYEREAVPYKAFDGVVDALTRFLLRDRGNRDAFLPLRPGPLAQVFPVLRRVPAFATAPTLAIDPLEIRNRAFAGMRELLARLAERHPLILSIDDTQWADADSLALLAEVLRPPEAPAMLLIATMRATALSGEATLHAKATVLDSLVHLPGDVRRLSVSRLTDDEARQLAGSLLQRVAGDGREASPEETRRTAATIAGESEGHPFFIDALVRHAAVSGRLRAGRLQEALWTTVAGLAPAPRRIVEILSIASTPVTLDALAEAVEVAPEAFERHVALLRVAHLVNVTGLRPTDTAEPYHDRIRAAVLAHLDQDALIAHHGSLATALARSPEPDHEALARHLAAVGETALAAEHAVAAGDEAMAAVAFDRAAALYQTALDLRPVEARTDAQRVRLAALREKLGDALTNAGRGASAADAYAEAARSAQPGRALQLRKRAAEELLKSGHLDRGMLAADELLATVGVSLPHRRVALLLALWFWRLRVALRGTRFERRSVGEVAAIELTRVDLCWSVAFALSVTDTIRAAAIHARGLLLALSVGEPMRIARSLALHAIVAAMAGGKASKVVTRILRRAHELADGSGDVYTQIWMQSAEGVAQYLVGGFRASLNLCDEARERFLASCVGVTWETSSSDLFAANCLAQLGALGELGRRVSRAVQQAIARGDRYASVSLRVGFPNLRWLVADDVAGARLEVTEAMSEWSKQGFHLEHFYELLALSSADLYAGDVAPARARVDRCWSSLRWSLLMRIQSVRTLALFLRARVRLASAEGGERERAALLSGAAGDARAIEREKMAWATPHATLIRAGVAHVRGDTEAAQALLREAAAGFDAVDMALHAAAARRCLGKLTGGDEGARLIDRAEAWMRSETVKNPARMTAMLAPGFGKRG